MGALFGLLALFLLPLVFLGVLLGLLGAAFKVLFVLLVLPFKIVGGLVKAVFGLFFGLLGGLFGLAAGGAGLLIGLFVLIAVFVLLPLAPLFLIGGILWLAVKAFSPSAIRPV